MCMLSTDLMDALHLTGTPCSPSSARHTSLVIALIGAVCSQQHLLSKSQHSLPWYLYS